MKANNMKKIVLFIVEGNSDKKALEKIFQAIYKNRNIVFRFTDGDITSDHTISKENICDEIYSKVQSYLNQNKLRKNDIWQIVQIFDTDGTYIPESAVFAEDTEEFIYSLTHISCKNVKKAIERNQKKSEIINYLLTIDQIKGVSYTSYFMSSNLDHALYDEQNLTDNQKGLYADSFYSEFSGKEELFIEYLEEEVANGVPDNYSSSWRYIKEELHSLERHTNLHIYFRQNMYK